MLFNAGGWWVRQPFVTKAALGSEPTERRIQNRFGRADQFPGVTKLCRRNGAANWAQCSGDGVRSRGCPGASQSFGLRRQASWLKVWREGRVDFDATERAHSGTEARLTRNAGGEVWSRHRVCNKIKPPVLMKICQWNQKNCIFRRLPVFV